MLNLVKKSVAVLILIATMMSPSFAQSGSFIGVEGESVQGTAMVKDGQVKLSSNFRSSRGPDLYVYLGNEEPTKIIAKLKKRSGSQTYELPNGIDLSKYSSVFIHCKRFDHTFGRADLK